MLGWPGMEAELVRSPAGIDVPPSLWPWPLSSLAAKLARRIPPPERNPSIPSNPFSQA